MEEKHIELQEIGNLLQKKSKDRRALLQTLKPKRPKYRPQRAVQWKAFCKSYAVPKIPWAKTACATSRKL